MKRLSKKDIEDIFALTPLQEGILFQYLKNPGSNYYFEQLSLEITGVLNINGFESAWNFVIASNQMLRAVFRWETVENPMQIILKKYILQPRYYDFSGEKNSDKKKWIETIRARDREKGFDLREVPFRVTLCKLEKNRYILILSNHHILYDGWSNGIILKEFFEAYNSFSKGSTPVKPEKTGFKEFVKWVHNQDAKKQERFWRCHLKCFDSQTTLSIKKRKTGEKSDTGTYRIKYPTELKNKLEDFVKTYKITLASLLYTAWGIVLQGYNNIDDVVFGTTVSGRTVEIKGIENIVGLFINTIPLRVQSLPGEKISSLVYRVDKGLQMREAYESAPLVKVKEYSEIGHIEELFDILIIIENYPLDSMLTSSIGDSSILNVHSYSITEISHYDLIVEITVFADLQLTFIYNRDVFDEDLIATLANRPGLVLERMVRNPGEEVAEIEIITGEEKTKLLFEFNDTTVDFPLHQTVYGIFSGQAERTPDYTALEGQPTVHKSPATYKDTSSGRMHITYRELNENTDQVATFFRETGVGPGSLVGLMALRSVEMVVLILAILKTGAAYLPIEPNQPEVRINYILKDSNTKILVAPPSFSYISEKLKSINCQVMIVDCQQEKEKIPMFPMVQKTMTTALSIPRTVSHYRQLAYILYTSGSTGKPKGVMIEHPALLNLLLALQKKYPFTETHVYLLKTPYVFDISITELFGWFFEGGKLAIPGKDIEKYPVKLLDMIEVLGVTHINFVPSMFNLFVDILNIENIGKLCGLKYIFLGGEAVFPNAVERFNRLNTTIPLENMYGPTEGTVYASKYSLSEWNPRVSINVPIGKPIQNIRIYILSKSKHLQPPGVSGELYIGGIGVARGYLNRPELTSERFILAAKSQRHKDVYFSCIPGVVLAKLYKSGDLARWLSDGNIEYLGRIDFQVKIRGFRIELGEIENHLINYDQIKEAVVTPKEDSNGDKYLCAYIVPVGPRTVEVSDLRRHMLKELPDYMCPTYFVTVERIPLNPNGKVDIKALPIPVPGIYPVKNYTAPRDEIEHKLVDIWWEVLARDTWQLSQPGKKPGIDDNFFELGGHSLTVTRMAAKIHKEWNITIPIADFFNAPTIRVLATYIKRTAKEKSESIEYDSIECVEKKEYYKVSSAQRRLYTIQQMNLDSTVYNMSGVYVLEGNPSKTELEAAASGLIKRQESLRTSFDMINGEVVQRLSDHITFEILLDNSREIFSESSSIRYDLDRISLGMNYVNAFIRPFDLSRPPLLRIDLFKLETEKYLFVCDIHHIIADGLSLNILIEELATLYAGKELPRLYIQYKDFAAWQGSSVIGAKAKDREKYWLRQFAGEIPVLNLPYDFPRPAFQDFDGDTVSFKIGEDQTGKLKALGLQTESTTYIMILSIFNVLLSKLSGQEDIVVGTVTEGRQQNDLQNMIGMFVNTLPLRNITVADESFLGFLKKVRGNFLKAFENQDYQYEDLVDRVVKSRNLSRNPLFDVMLVFQDLAATNMKIPGLNIKPYFYNSGVSKFDLTLTIEENKVKEDLHLIIEFPTKLFKRETVIRFGKYLLQVVRTIIKTPGERLGNIQLLTGAEKRQILFGLNGAISSYPVDRSIHDYFLHQVQKGSDHIALLGVRQSLTGKQVAVGLENSGQIQISYRELNKNANYLASRLKERGVGLDSIVGLMVERCLEMIIGIIGIVRAGGAYLPVDPDYPGERLRYMLNDSAAGILVTTSNITGEVEKIKNWSGETIFIDEQPVKVETMAKTVCQHLEPAPVTSSSLVYIIYTSGTTGRPKGVLVEQGNLLSLFFNEAFSSYFNCRDIWTMFHSYSFDFSVWEVFGALLYGGKLIILPSLTAINMADYLDRLKKHGVTVLSQIPSVFYRLIDTQLTYNDKGLGIRGLRYVIFGGEALNVVKLKEWKKHYPATRLINMFGITETTVHVTVKEITDLDIERGISNIGKPIPTLCAYIVDKEQNLQPMGVTGELLVGGGGVSRGYLNRPELTGQRYINYKSQNVYKTGDLVRLLENYDMQYLGRIDHQVQLRGFRIETEEIEKQLLLVPGVKEAVVVDIEHENKPGDKYLCAYMVTGSAFAGANLKTALSLVLPQHMIPSFFIRIERIPLTSQGKVDRKSLPLPEMNTGRTYQPPGNRIEKKLIEIWSEILDIKKDIIGIDADFIELGGHSLKAVVLTSRIHKEFSVKIPLKDVFSHPTIKELAAVIQVLQGSKTEQYLSIELAEEKEYYPLSSAQKRLYVLQQLEDQETGTVYNIPTALTMAAAGTVELNRFEDVFKRLIQRHESLRTSFQPLGDEPVQKIHKQVEFEIECYDTLENIPKDAKQIMKGSSPQIIHEDVATIISGFIRHFNLSQAPLLRVGLIRPANPGNIYILLLDMHHIISDGVSYGILMQDFARLYHDGEHGLPPLRLQYKDYSQWQTFTVEKEKLKGQEDFWLQEFAREVPVLDLPMDFPRPLVQDFAGSTLDFKIDGILVEKLKLLVREQGVTLYALLLCIFNIFLAKLCAREEIVVGTPTAGRKHADLTGIMGIFVNTLVLRNYPVGERVFIEFLKEVKEQTFTAFENQEYPLEYLLEKMQAKRDPGRNPLFDVMFDFQETDISAIYIPGLTLSRYQFESKISKFDLTLQVLESGDDLAFSFEYSSKLFKLESVERFARYFNMIVSQALEHKEKKIEDIEILPAEEKQLILFSFNQTTHDYPREKVIHGLFAEQAGKTPDCTGLILADQALTYRELDVKTNRLARVLRKKGAKPDTPVGIIADKSIEMITGIIGILKSGASYLPIDTGYPGERIKYILKDSRLQMVVLQTHVLERNEVLFKEFPSENIICLEDEMLSSLSPGERFILGMVNQNVNRAGHLAYVIYTSGSTGNPRGVLVTHGNVVAYIHAFYREFDIDGNDRFLQQASFCFDAFIEEVFPVLLKGGSLAIPGKEEILDIHLLSTFISRYRVTMISCTPLLLNELNKCKSINMLYRVHTFISGGDELKFPYVDTLLQVGRVYNTYGPTETTVCATYFRCSGEMGKNVPIGKPVSNYRVLVLDKGNKPVPLRVPGELCISGAGTARGYLNRPELTAERFIFATKPQSHKDVYFTRSPGVLVAKLYKTGDLVRWLSDGNIEFLGRIDRQVKIRGYRIELGEIESRLFHHKDIREVLVMARENKNRDKYLCCYIVPVRDIPDLKREMQEYLSHNLPRYMMPAAFVTLEKIPLTPNGKIDLKLLPEPLIGLPVEQYAAPRDKVEIKLARIWAELLGVENGMISRESDFFDLGGHSLNATRMTLKIYKEFEVKVPLVEIFKEPLLKKLAVYVRTAVGEKFVAITLVEEREYYPMSPAQKRMFLLNHLKKNDTAYNTPGTVILEGKLDRQLFEESFNQLIRRHETLKTSFHLLNGEPVQHIHKQVDFKVNVWETPGLDQLPGDYADVDTTKQLKKIVSELILPFDLSQAPLFRVFLVRLSGEKHLLFIDMHHIISDDTSTMIIIDELVSLYKGMELTRLRIQYRDFTIWQKSVLQSDRVKKQLEYWLGVFSPPEEIPVLEIPTGLPGSVNQNAIHENEGDYVDFQLSKELSVKLNRMALESGATLYIVILSIFTILLSRYSGQEDIVVGTPAAGRAHPDLDHLIGMFVNTLAIRNFPHGEKTFNEFLEEVKSNALNAYENQDYQFDDLVDQLGIKRHPNRHPLFDAMLTIQNIDRYGERMLFNQKIGNLTFIPYDAAHKTAPFALALQLWENDKNDNKICFKCRYRTALFKPEMIEALTGHFINITEEVTTDPNITISRIKMFSPKDREKLFFPSSKKALDNLEIDFALEH